MSKLDVEKYHACVIKFFWRKVQPEAIMAAVKHRHCHTRIDNKDADITIEEHRARIKHCERDCMMKWTFFVIKAV